MQPRDVEISFMRGNEFGGDGVEIERRGVDHARAWRTQRDDLTRHQRSRIEAYRTARHQVLATHGDQIGSAGTTVAVKDLIDLAGLPTTAGCRALERAAGPAAADAACMAGLRAGWGRVTQAEDMRAGVAEQSSSLRPNPAMPPTKSGAIGHGAITRRRCPAGTPSECQPRIALFTNGSGG